MICEQCGLEFEVGDELKRLIAAKAVPQVCDNCAEAPPPLPFGHKYIAPPDVRTINSVLYRVDRFNAEGISVQWIGRMPRYPRLKRKRPRRAGRRDDQIGAFVMTFGTKNLTNKPIMAICSNLDTFQRLGKPFRVWKVPGYQSALTGQDKIEVPAQDVDHIEDDGSLELYVHLKDGGKIRLKFRNN